MMLYRLLHHAYDPMAPDARPQVTTLWENELGEEPSNSFFVDDLELVGPDIHDEGADRFTLEGQIDDGWSYIRDIPQPPDPDAMPDHPNQDERYVHMR